jgi:hypothetical protein
MTHRLRHAIGAVALCATASVGAMAVPSASYASSSSTLCQAAIVGSLPGQYVAYCVSAPSLFFRAVARCAAHPGGILPTNYYGPWRTVGGGEPSTATCGNDKPYLTTGQVQFSEGGV